MNKIVEYLLEMSFIAILIRCLCLGATPGDALLGISLVISICYKHYYILRNKITDKQDIQSDFENLQKQIEDIKSAVTSMKLNTSLTRKPHEKEQNIPGRRF